MISIQKVEPTYLRFAINGLKNSHINGDNSSSLPIGLIGLFEESFSHCISTANRSALLQKLAIWAIFKRPVSISLMASVSGIDETTAKSIVNSHSKWFNSTESGKYELYHERLKNFLLSKLSQTDFKILNVKLITILRSKQLSPELLIYRFNHYVEHLIQVCILDETYKEELNLLVYNDEHWDNGFVELKSGTAGLENVRNIISYAVYHADWQMLHRCTELILNLHQKNEALCEDIILNGNFNFEQIEFCFDSLPTDFERLRFISLITVLQIQNDHSNYEVERLKLIWDRMNNYLSIEHPNWLTFLPFWVLHQLRDFGLINQIDVLTNGLNEVDLTNLNSTSDWKHNFHYMYDSLSEFSIKDRKSFKLLLTTLNNQESEFNKIFTDIDVPNLMDRDELICRATEICIEQNHGAYIEWLFWLIVHSGFEVGEHAPPDEKHYTKGLIGKYLQICDKNQLNGIEQLITASNLLPKIKMELRCWLSDKYRDFNEYEKAIMALNHFQVDIQSTFNPVPWKINSIKRTKLSYDHSGLKPSDKIDILLNFNSISTLDFCEIDSILKDLNHDKISKAEYFAEISLRVVNQNSETAIKLLNEAWRMVANTKDWASFHVKAELLATALQIMDEPWIKSKLKIFKKEYKQLTDDLDFISMAFNVFYNYKPTRFNSRNLLPLVIQNKDIHSFLKKVDPNGLSAALNDEKVEDYIIFKARNSTNFREFWSSVKRYFLLDGVGSQIQNFWSLFNSNSTIFENLTSEDIRIIAVISRKSGQHFPIEEHLNKSRKLEVYKDRIPIPNDFEFGSKKGFKALFSNKTSNFGDICRGIFKAPRIDNEIDHVSINATAYMLKKSIGNKNSVKDIGLFIKLKIEVNSTSLN